MSGAESNRVWGWIAIALGSGAMVAAHLGVRGDDGLDPFWIGLGMSLLGAYIAGRRDS